MDVAALIRLHWGSDDSCMGRGRLPDYVWLADRPLKVSPSVGTNKQRISLGWCKSPFTYVCFLALGNLIRADAHKKIGAPVQEV
jgi:hypothetical protein